MQESLVKVEFSCSATDGIFLCSYPSDSGIKFRTLKTSKDKHVIKDGVLKGTEEIPNSKKKLYLWKGETRTNNLHSLPMQMQKNCINEMTLERIERQTNYIQTHKL